MNRENSVIANHRTSTLSSLDMEIVKAVPPGGNWKNTPLNIKSKRIQQIRQSFEEGKGSRSTYYGRLLPDKPSYTINTYFNRPGNGCHIHYSQDRVLSQREAARLQSFPDSFIFNGSQGAINTQIGNAVPPLLAYQLAHQITQAINAKPMFVDLFSGAGGMGYGFKSYGWTPIVANDIEETFVQTYAMNIHENVVAGSITDEAVFKALVRFVREAKKRHKGVPLWILGGPPCQGFSTAGNKRSMEDQRNHLFIYYKEFIKEVKPDGFVFENVAGLLSMEKGQVFEKVKAAFSEVMPSIDAFVINSEQYAIPQRRKRIILIGQKKPTQKIGPPDILTSLNASVLCSTKQKPCVSVEEALSDLPPLKPGEDGEMYHYLSSPSSSYQKLMRGKIGFDEFLSMYGWKPGQIPSLGRMSRT